MWGQLFVVKETHYFSLGLDTDILNSNIICYSHNSTSCIHGLEPLFFVPKRFLSIWHLVISTVHSFVNTIIASQFNCQSCGIGIATRCLHGLVLFRTSCLKIVHFKSLAITFKLRHIQDCMLYIMLYQMYAYKFLTIKVHD